MYFFLLRLLLLSVTQCFHKMFIKYVWFESVFVGRATGHQLLPLILLLTDTVFNIGLKLAHSGTNKEICLLRIGLSAASYQVLLYLYYCTALLNYFLRHIFFLELFIVSPSLHFLSPFILRSARWIQSKSSSGTDGVTPCMSRPWSQHMENKLLTLAFTLADTSVHVEQN